jgi:hypothetical protein
MGSTDWRIIDSALRDVTGPVRLRGEWLRDWFGGPVVDQLFGSPTGVELAVEHCRPEGTGLVAEGTVDVPRLLLRAAAAMLHVQPDGTGGASARMTIACPSLIDCFPDLWEVQTSLALLLGSEPVAGAHFTLCSGDDDALQRGLNFEARWRPSGVPGLLADALQAADAVDLRGPVVLAWPATQATETADFPWELEHRLPGLYLKAKLGTLPLDAVGLGKAELGVELYLPCESRPGAGGIACAPVRAYTGTLKVPGGTLSFTAMHVPSLLDELVLQGRFEADGDAGHASALSTLLHDAPLTRFLPDEVANVVGDFRLATLGLRLATRADGGLRLASTHLGIAFSHKPPHWSPVPGLACAVFFERLDLVVVHPEAGASPQFFGSARAGADLFGSTFALTLRVPDFLVTLEQTGGPISTDTLFEACLPPPAPRPPSFEIDRLSVMIDPGASYAIAVAIRPGKSWTAVDGHPAFPEVRLAVSSAGWSFVARTEGNGVPVVDLVNRLAQDVGLGALELPPVLHTLTVDALCLSHGGGDFALELEGSLALDTGGAPARLRAKLGLDVSRRAGEANAAPRFGGQLIVEQGGRPTLEFDLAVASSTQGSTLVASFHDDEGLHVHVGDLLAGLPVAEGLRTAASGIELVLHDALLVFEKPAAGPGRLLLALDVEGGIELSAPQLPSLPLVSQWPVTGESLKLAVQLTVASAKFLEGQVTAVKALDAAAAFLPAAGIAAGVGVNAALRIGARVERLNAPPAQPQQLAGPAGGPPDVAPPPSDGTQWIDIRRSFGPVRFERVGVNYRDGKVWALLDAAFTAAGLTISLDGLSVRTPLSPWQPTFGLRGLGIDYRNGAVEIGGAFLQRDVNDDAGHLLYSEFAGGATLRAKQLTLSATGMYAQLDGHPSLFLYAVLNSVFGGPPFFVVTGLAAGFGYNRALVLPSLEDLPSFPLIAQALPVAEAPQGPAAVLGALGRYVPASVGESFLAVGVRFTSFKIVDSFALLVGRFSHRFEIDLLGLSTLVAPPSAGSATLRTPIAQAQLAIKATFVPDEGILGVQGLVTPGSYVLSRACRLSGGFAFFSWFKDQPGEDGAKAGDFVATLGGYHPEFVPPKHYPAVPRLQLQWQVNDRLAIKGSAYYALTAHALMAGGLLEAVWSDSDVHVSFTASADFLLAWQPYHYDARVSVQMHADITLHVFGTHQLSFDAGAGLHLWGPEFSGTAEVHLSVLGFDVSFNVEFGDQQALPCAVEWTSFRQAFLPADLVGAAIEAGLVRSLERPDSAWVVDPLGCRITVTSLVPVTAATHLTSKVDDRLGVSPMGVLAEQFASQLHVTVRNANGDDVSALFDFKPIRKAMPAAMWGKPAVYEVHGQRFVKPPALNGKPLIEEVLVGLALCPAVPLPEHKPPPGRPNPPEALVVKLSGPALATADALAAAYRQPRNAATADLVRQYAA